MQKNAVEEKDENTVLGKVTKNIPGTDAYQIDAEINTLLSNLGFNALNSARAASANGASGFGQLTEREMEILQSLIAPLKFGLKKEEFISQLDRIESFLTESQSRLKNNWDVDSWIGLPSSKPKDTTELSDDELMAKYGEV